MMRALYLYLERLASFSEVMAYVKRIGPGGGGYGDTMESKLM
jgi:hypothetical protein